MTTYILGSGPAGMAVADGLLDNGDGAFVVFEREGVLGGLARTVEWADVGRHDLGPHKIFSLDQELIARIERLLPAENWLTREKTSTIYMAGRYLPYPPSPFSLAGVFGLGCFVRMIAGFALAKLSGVVRRAPQTFEEDLVGRLGGPLYRVLFKPIAEKLWGDPRQLDVKLSKGRVQTPSVFEVLGRMLKVSKSSGFEALTFRYPRGGLGRIWDAIAAKAGDKDKSRFLLKHCITGLDAKEGRIERIRFTSAGVPGEILVKPEDRVVSTLPLALLVNLLGQNLPPQIAELTDRLVVLNDLLLVFLHIDKPNLINESWVFIPDPKIIFHRLSEQESFDPAMTPNGSIVCCEVMSHAGRPMSDKKNEDLVAAAREGLAAMGYTGFEVLGSRVIRLPRSYPVFVPGYEAALEEILGQIDRFSNLRTIGRQGAFNYIGTIDAMDIGYGYAQWVASGEKTSWAAERKRTSHYPVLD